MTLHAPFEISARLLPCVGIGKSFVSIEFAGTTDDGRTRYQYHIDTPEFEYTGSDLKSRVGGGSLQEGLESLLGFLGACVESIRYGRKYDPDGNITEDGENADLFPANVAEWAIAHSDEIDCLQLELEENKNLITD